MKNKANNAQLNKVERDLIEGLEEFRDALVSGKKISGEFTCRKVVLDLHPHAYTPEMVKAARSLLRVSQALFAQFLGVSPKTVRAWEGGKEPSEMACRFMDEIRRDPVYWRRRLVKVTRVKTA
jgi:putative transcriptional regulator